MPSVQEDRKAKSPRKEKPTLEKYGFPATLFVLSAAISPISQLTLAPLYGAIPSAVNHTIALAFAVAVGFGSWIADGSPQKSQHIWITVFPFWVPVIQHVLLSWSKNMGPVTGAILNGAISCHAVLVASVYALAEGLAVFDLTPYVGPRVGDTIKAAVLLPAVLGMEKRVTEWIGLLLSNSKTLTPVHLQVALASAYSLYFPSWYLLLGLPALIHTYLVNPHISTAAANAALSAHNWTLIDRQWSNTGYISVLDSFNENYRVLRCDHSLLGGEWFLTEQRKAEGWKVNEPIYSAFEMLEAVRLMQVGPDIPDHEAHALVIGLGVGTAPKALITHGIDTTIIELDPVVHAFAKQYFDLPSNHTAVLQDATTWVDAAASHGDKKYDYIIHDVFTGGVEPLALFNVQFLRNLRNLLKPHGAIALNYAGDLVNPLTRSVLHTIDHVFSGQTHCKIFRDGPPQQHALSKGSHEDFLNMVIFCTNAGERERESGGHDTGDGGQGPPPPPAPPPAFFRPPRQADYLHRQSAQHYLLPKPEHEIPFPDPSREAREAAESPGDGTNSEPGAAKPAQTQASRPLTFISLLEPLRALRDDPSFWTAEAPDSHTHDPYTPADMGTIEAGDEKKYATQQEESAIRHWYIMRSVLPDAVWELW